jgi:virulence-associated protein VagC
MGEILHKQAFKSGNGVAVYIPKSFGIEPGMAVTIETRGDEVVIRRAQNMHALVDTLLALPAPGDIEERDPEIFIDRPGL